MSRKQNWKLIAGMSVFILVTFCTLPCADADPGFSDHREVFGPNHDFHPQCVPPQFPEIVQRYGPPPGPDPVGRIRYWSQIMLNANALDHTPAGDMRQFGDQLGPARTARAFAIVQIAVFDAVNAITGGFESYTGIAPEHGQASLDAAIAKAAHDTLAALCPSQAGIFRNLLIEDLNRIPDGPRKVNGIHTGRRAAAAILALREGDGSQHEEPIVGVGYFPSNKPGKWRPDPISMSPLALGAFWGSVDPFVLKSDDQFLVPRPPSIKSRKYATAFNEVKRLGGDGITTPTERNDDQTIAGIYWSYDGTPGLGTPPRLYNQIAVQIAKKMGSDAVELARLLALINTGMADGGTACWLFKYEYEYWRPIAGIREADSDRNARTISDPDWTPLGAQASNLTGPDFTPPFPAYASGHATFGGILFQILRKFYKTDSIAFTFVSDELNGVTRDNFDPDLCLEGEQGGERTPNNNCGQVRPRIFRMFSSLSEAEEENAQSRIYLGVHWQFDATEGAAHGRRIADYVFKNAFLPLH